MAMVNWEKASRLPRHFKKVRLACDLPMSPAAMSQRRSVANHKHHRLQPKAPLTLAFSSSLLPGETFGQVVKKARLEKGLHHQADVAQIVGVDPMTIVNWERFRRMPQRFKRSTRSVSGWAWISRRS